MVRIGRYYLRRCMSCGRRVWQRDELWEGTCVPCERADDPTSGFYRG